MARRRLLMTKAAIARRRRYRLTKGTTTRRKRVGRKRGGYLGRSKYPRVERVPGRDYSAPRFSRGGPARVRPYSQMNKTAIMRASKTELAAAHAADRKQGRKW